MNQKNNILIILIVILYGNCNSYKPIIKLEDNIVKGRVVDGKSGEIFIGQSIYEFNRNSNNTITDTLGNFELQFLGEHPIIKLTGFYEPIYAKVNPNQLNEIVINPKTIRESKKIYNKVSRFIDKRKRKFSNISLAGNWEVIKVNKFVNPEWKYLDEIEPGSTNKRLSKLFPSQLKEKDSLIFKDEGTLLVNNSNEYQFSKGDNYLSISYSDIVFMYEYEFKNEDLLLFKKGLSLGETEWIIKRK